ncbi:MAG TPA: hypothetical protein VMO88_04265 [Acidimicrobiales bacterium]|nr:hypothetical protein [Acidimicrobiales bacterium]
MTSTVRAGHYDPDNTDAAAEAVPSRHAALVGATAGLRPGRSRSFPLETVMLVLGGFLLPIGIIAIIVGWYGAAHTPKLYEQNDYLISGGLLGLGLVFIGGFLYFGYWMTRQIHTTSTVAQQTLRALSRIETQLAANGNHSSNGTSYGAAPSVGVDVRVGAAAGAAVATGEAGEAGEAGRSGRVGAGRRGRAQAAAVVDRPASRGYTASTAVPELVATERGNLLHRPDCPVVANRDNLRAVEPGAPGFRPCQICSPLG